MTFDPCNHQRRPEGLAGQNQSLKNGQCNTQDVGITVYLSIVCLFFFLQQPLRIIRPVFFADPCGALVGKFCSKREATFGRNPRWIGEKTLYGSVAVFIASILSLAYGSVLQKVVLSLAIAFTEGMSKDYDNLGIAAVVLVGWYFIGDAAAL